MKNYKYISAIALVVSVVGCGDGSNVENQQGIPTGTQQYQINSQLTVGQFGKFNNGGSLLLYWNTTTNASGTLDFEIQYSVNQGVSQGMRWIPYFDLICSNGESINNTNTNPLYSQQNYGINLNNCEAVSRTQYADDYGFYVMDPIYQSSIGVGYQVEVDSSNQLDRVGQYYYSIDNGGILLQIRACVRVQSQCGPWRVIQQQQQQQQQQYRY